MNRVDSEARSDSEWCRQWNGVDSEQSRQWMLYTVKGVDSEGWLGLPDVRFLTGLSGIIVICPVKKLKQYRTCMCPVFSIFLVFSLIQYTSRLF